MFGTGGNTTPYSSGTGLALGPDESSTGLVSRPDCRRRACGETSNDVKAVIDVLRITFVYSEIRFYSWGNRLDAKYDRPVLFLGAS